MYKNLHFDRNSQLVHLWTDGKNGDKPYSCFPFERYAYQVDPHGDKITLNGLKVKKVTNWSKEAEKQGLVFEHDVRTETRVLIDRYYGSDDVSVDHNILFLDIEIAKEGKYSKPSEAFNTITSIAYYTSVEKKYHCLLLDPDCKLEDKVIDGTFLRRFSREDQLLAAFITEYQKLNVSIITSWNGDSFDMPYLFNRLTNVLGDKVAKKLSPIGIVYPNDYGRDYSIKIAGVSQLDYLKLYKNYNYNEEPRYTLDAISKKELGRGKVEYEGSLDQLFERDPLEFVRYNVSDVELLVAMNDKLDFIAIALGICHKGHVPYEDFSMSSRIMDGASLVYCKRHGKIASGIQGDESGKAEGAFVKMPKPGLYEYVYTLDATSLYPSNIISLNISPETLVGKIENWSEDDYVSKKDTDININFYVNSLSDSLMGAKENQVKINLQDFQKYLEENNLSVASNGALYSLNEVGFLPSILTDWFAERKEYRRIASELKLKGDLNGYRYYDKKQLITKILLNSFYGVLLLPSFRFYNKTNGEAVTTVGQSVLQYAIKVINFYYNKKLNTQDIDYVVMGDTDSNVGQALPLIRLDYDGNDEEELIKRTLEIVDQVQEVVNKSFNMYAKRFHNVTNHMWEFKQEVIARRAFFGQAKKRYAMWIINKNRLKVDELEVKGMDIVRSSFPLTFRKFLKQVVVDILQNKSSSEMNTMIGSFKSAFKSESLRDILLPTGVKELSKFRQGQKGTPVHVKSAQNYNKLLELFKIENLPKIEDGDKILWAYLKPNSFGFETLAIRGYDDPDQIVEFLERFINKDEIFNRSLMSKLETIWEDLGWGKINLDADNDFF